LDLTRGVVDPSVGDVGRHLVVVLLTGIFRLAFHPVSVIELWAIAFLYACLKVHKHEIVLNFFLPKSQPYRYDLGQYSNKNFDSFPLIFVRISMFEHFCGD
jgi:hypothetical protein